MFIAGNAASVTRHVKTLPPTASLHVPVLRRHGLSCATVFFPGGNIFVVRAVSTVVDSTRHRGTCYRAANWLFLGLTQGRGKDDLTHRPNRTLKDVWPCR
jgi:Domain of unknown function (DUF4338)